MGSESKKSSEHMDDIINDIVMLSRSINEREGKFSDYGEMVITMQLLRLKSDLNYINECIQHKDVFYDDDYVL